VHFIGRQPILDRAQQLFGYELLSRTGWENCFTGNPETVGQQMIDTTLLFGIDNLVHGSKAFVNCTHDSLTSRYVTCLPPGTVLEVSKSVAVDDAVFAACKELKQQGYAIALDDFMPGTSSDRLIELAAYIKIDCRLCDAIELCCIQSQLYRPDIALIAEKVETAEQFQRALDAGYQYFQGYFFAHPTILTSREIPSNPLLYIKLLNAMQRVPLDANEIERLVGSDSALRPRLLRLVNSVDFGARDLITDVHQALLLIGEAKLRKLVPIAAVACLKTDAQQSPELMVLCLQRARFCELIAPLAGHSPGEQYLIGLLSLIDAVLNTPLDQVLKMIALPPAAAAALRGEASPVDLPLSLIRHYEQGDWEICAALCRTLHISDAELTNIYMDSLQWATQQISDSAKETAAAILPPK